MNHSRKDPILLVLRYWPIIAVLIGVYLLSSGWAAILLYHAGIIGAVKVTGTPFQSVFRGFEKIPCVLLLIVGLVAGQAVMLVFPLLLGMPAEQVAEQLQAGLSSTGLTGVWFWAFIGYLCLPHPAIEELGWRELLFVDSRLPHLRDFEFASYYLLVMHYFFPFEWLFFLGTLLSLAACGWVWRLLKMKYQGLAVPIWFHAGGDMGAMLGVLWLISRA